MLIIPKPSSTEAGRLGILLNLLARRLSSTSGLGGGGRRGGDTSEAADFTRGTYSGSTLSVSRNNVGFGGGVGGAETTVVAVRLSGSSSDVVELRGGVVVVITSDLLNFGGGVGGVSDNEPLDVFLRWLIGTLRGGLLVLGLIRGLKLSTLSLILSK